MVDEIYNLLVSRSVMTMSYSSINCLLLKNKCHNQCCWSIFMAHRMNKFHLPNDDLMQARDKLVHLHFSKSIHSFDLNKNAVKGICCLSWCSYDVTLLLSFLNFSIVINPECKVIYVVKNCVPIQLSHFAVCSTQVFNILDNLVYFVITFPIVFFQKQVARSIRHLHGGSIPFFWKGACCINNHNSIVCHSCTHPYEPE